MTTLGARKSNPFNSSLSACELPIDGLVDELTRARRETVLEGVPLPASTSLTRYSLRLRRVSMGAREVFWVREIFNALVLNDEGGEVWDRGVCVVASEGTGTGGISASSPRKPFLEGEDVSDGRVSEPGKRPFLRSAE